MGRIGKRKAKAVQCRVVSTYSSVCKGGIQISKEFNLTLLNSRKKEFSPPVQAGRDQGKEEGKACLDGCLSCWGWAWPWRAGLTVRQARFFFFSITMRGVCMEHIFIYDHP